MASDLDRLLPLKPTDFYILITLIDGKRHGYRIAREVRDLSGDRIRMEAGNLHRTVQKLIKLGLVTVKQERGELPATGEARRRYYGITPLGRRAVAADAARMRQVVNVVRAKGIIIDQAVR